MTARPKTPRLTAGDQREISKACTCPPDAKRGDACSGVGSRGAMRCVGRIDKWNEPRRLRGIIPSEERGTP